MIVVINITRSYYNITNTIITSSSTLPPSSVYFGDKYVKRCWTVEASMSPLLDLQMYGVVAENEVA